MRTPISNSTAAAAAQPNDAEWELWAIRVLSCVELFFSVPCLICNFYFAFRVAIIASFSPNLKTILISTNIIAALLAFLRPVLHFGFSDGFSVERGEYAKAALFYSGRFVVEICLFALDGKFLMVGLERASALRHRATYEYHDGRMAWRMVGCYIGSTTFLLTAKILLFLYAYRDLSSTDLWLDTAFITDRCLPLFVFSTVYATASWITGVVQFHRLRVFVRRHRYDGRTLSESFQIKQVGTVVEVLGPLLYAFGSGVLYCTFLYCGIIFLVTRRGYSIRHPLIMLIQNAEYLSIGAYTLFSTMYMIWYFPPLRRMALDDIQRVCRITITAPLNSRINAKDERQVHFDYLEKAWK